MIKTKRVYEKYEKADGFRVLVDRLWPRGVSKQEAKIDIWLKEIAPSNELRNWFSHDPKKWSEFKKKYKHELDNKKNVLNTMLEITKKEKVLTLLYAAKNEKQNNAIALKELL